MERKKDTAKSSNKQTEPRCISLTDLVYWCNEILKTPMTRFSSLVIIFALVFSGCLTVEFKEYTIKLKNDHSGEATIRFINILSEAEDTTDVSADDFKQLIEFYLQGTQLEKDNPGYRNAKKRLYEQDGVLVGEVTFTFDSLSALRIFKYDKESPYMYFVGHPLSSEQYVESNGAFGRDWMPVVFWPKDTKELTLKTKVVSEVSHQRSLLKNFREWQSTESGQGSRPNQKKQ